jgi:stage III sporulation protein AF
MLTGVYQWIRNLAGYFLFLAVLEQLLPNKNYSRYIRLFAGMILILLVVQPLADLSRINERIAHYFEELEFRYDAEHLQEEIFGVEEQQLKRLIAQYETSVSEEIIRMAAEEGYEAAECQAEIDKDPESETFGSVVRVKLRLYLGAVYPGAADAMEATEDTAGAPESMQRTPEHTVSYLQKRIASCYHLEENYVEIQVSQRPG